MLRTLRRVPVGLFPVSLPFLLLPSPLLALYSIARGARLAAWRVFVRGGAPAPVHDPRVARLKTLRTWAAVAVTIAVVAALGDMRDVGQHLTEQWATLLLAPWLLIASGPVVLGVLIWLAPPATPRCGPRCAARCANSACSSARWP